MDNEKDILSKFNHHDGMTVPDGYFSDFAKRMESALPEKSETSVVAIPRTTWQRIRPYVYMAAMFAGVWCMLKMFSLMLSNAIVPIEENPTIAEAVENKDFVEDYIINDINQWEVYDDMIEAGIDMHALNDAFVLSTVNPGIEQ